MVVFFQMSITNIKAFQKHVEINNIEVPSYKQGTDFCFSHNFVTKVLLYFSYEAGTKLIFLAEQLVKISSSVSAQKNLYLYFTWNLKCSGASKADSLKRIDLRYEAQNPISLTKAYQTKNTFRRRTLP